MLTWKRTLIAACCLIILTAAFTAFILPTIIMNKAESWVAEHTGRTLQIGELTINPVTLVVEVHNLTLSDVNPEQSFVTWKTLRVALSPHSLLRLAPVLREVRLTEPRIHLERLEANRFNFSDLAPAGAGSDDGPDHKEPARFSLNNIIIENGQIELIDSSIAGNVTHTVQQLNLAIPFLGNLPYMVDDPVQPLFSAVINDSPFEIKGALKPFAETREFSLRFALNDIDLPYYLAYLPMKLPVDLRSGRLNLDMKILYRAGKQQAPELLLSGEVNLTALNLWDSQSRQLVFLPLLRAVIGPSHPMEQQFHLTSIDLYNPKAQLHRDMAGTWNIDRLIPTSSRKTDTPGNDKADPVVQLAIDAFRLRDGVLAFHDALPRGGFQTTAQAINIDLQNISLEQDTAIRLEASLTTDKAEQVQVQGHLGLVPLFVDVMVQAEKLPLAVYQPYYQEMVAIRPGGSLDLNARVTIDDDIPFALSEGRVALHNLGLPLPKQEGLQLARLTLNELSYDLATNALVLGRATLEKGQLRLSRDSDGRFSFRSPDYPVTLTTAETSTEPLQTTSTNDSLPFSFHVGEVKASEWSIDFRDQQPAEPAHLALTGLNLNLKDLAAPAKVASPFEIEAVLNRTGHISLSGKTTLATREISVSSRLRTLPLNILAPYISEQAGLKLVDGRLDAHLNSRINSTAKGVSARFDGAIGIDKLYCLDAAHQEDLIKWDSLQISGINGSWAPLDLEVESVTVNDYFAKVLIDEEGSLNFAQVFRQETVEDTQKPGDHSVATEKPLPATEESAAGKAAEVRIDRVTLQGGQVDFTDRHLPNPFHADMRELGGSITGLNSKLTTRADVDLRGKLRNQSPLVIAGTVNPLAEELFLDLKFSFNDIEMSPMSPYSGTYLGYLIEKGKLHLALDYQVEAGALKASNDVFLDQFTFGEPVTSDKATGLPVKLAVALLKDRNGEIHLDIPVSGDLNDPQFSIAGVIWTIIKNLLVKAATSPFALLGALAGGGDQDFSMVHFEPGLSTLPPTEQEKLSHIAKALLDRPALKLEIQGFVDPENDPEGYRHEVLRRQIERIWALERARQQEDATVPMPAIADLPPQDYSAYLWEAYKQADFPRPRNFVGMVKHLPDEELVKLIYTNTIVGDTEMARLAQDRAQTIRNYLVNEAGVAAERLFLTAPEITQPPEKPGVIRSRVEFKVGIN